ncbi:MAG: tRNA-dihydrouridine synthase family protein, partial [Kiritimatiellaceae bacterium]|nr:tRNA-dihydrouridine synthase family protein [Kiritimatiellaceae bacterium]
MNNPFLILAPMRGITTRFYRQAFVRHFQGLDAEMAPFIPTVNADKINPKLLRDILPENNSGLPLIPQLIGNNASNFVTMARAMNDLGFDEINWNLGCPHKPIRNKQRGSGLLPYPERVDALLNTICADSPCRVSVKVRLGISGPADLMQLIPVLNRYPLSEVIIHPRTAVQMYDGTVDLEAFAAARAELTHPICYNGDITDLPFFQSLEPYCAGVQRFMLG